MRRADRAVTDPAQLLEILNRCNILRLAMLDQEGLYIVPVSFGYVTRDDRLSFYIHSAQEGRKVSTMTPGCDVAFELDGQFRLQEADVACAYSCCFASLTGNGRAIPVEDPVEKALALSAIMKHQTGKDFSFSTEQTQSVAIFRIDITHMTGKRKQA